MVQEFALNLGVIKQIYFGSSTHVTLQVGKNSEFYKQLQCINISI